MISIHQRGQTALTEACNYYSEKHEVVTVLVRAGAKTDIQDMVQVVLLLK